jgi:hypothetical protein
MGIYDFVVGIVFGITLYIIELIVRELIYLRRSKKGNWDSAQEEPSELLGYVFSSISRFVRGKGKNEV